MREKLMSYAFIYSMDGNVLKGDFRWGVTPDEVLDDARTIARADRRSAIVENWLTGEVYRVTPAGHVWRAPKGWTPSWDEMFGTQREDTLQVELNRLAQKRQQVRAASWAVREAGDGGLPAAEATSNPASEGI
jgi:hypothetical protein